MVILEEQIRRWGMRPARKLTDSCATAASRGIAIIPDHPRMNEILDSHRVSSWWTASVVAEARQLPA